MNNSPAIKWHTWLIDSEAYESDGLEIPVTPRILVEATTGHKAKRAFYVYGRYVGYNIGDQNVKIPDTLTLANLLPMIRAQKCTNNRRRSRANPIEAMRDLALKLQGVIAYGNNSKEANTA